MLTVAYEGEGRGSAHAYVSFEKMFFSKKMPFLINFYEFFSKNAYFYLKNILQGLFLENSKFAMIFMYIFARFFC